MAGEPVDAMKRLFDAANHAAFVLRNPHMQREHRLSAAEMLDDALAAFDPDATFCFEDEVPDEA